MKKIYIGFTLLVLTLYNSKISLATENILYNDAIEKSDLVFQNSSIKSNKTYYSDGKIRTEGYTRNGIPDGEFKSYYPNGNIMEEGYYKNGLPHGLIRTYYENGQIANESNVVNGQFSGLVKSYYPSGKLKHKSFSNNHQPDGEDIFYYENGQIAIKGTYSNGVPLSLIAFDENGNELTSKQDIARILMHFVSLENIQ